MARRLGRANGCYSSYKSVILEFEFRVEDKVNFEIQSEPMFSEVLDNNRFHSFFLLRA